MDTGEVRRSLAELVKAYQDGDWRIPGFQREFIWPRYKIRNWAQTILDERRIRLGVIVTYQLLSEKQSGFPVYIADGRQRLEATIRFLENPRRYGFVLTPEQAWTYCNSYYVVVQHNHFESHDEGLWAFQALNLGTTVAPAEFYKGELTRFPNGLYLWQTIPSIVDKVSHHLCTKPATNKHRAVLQRDSLALFYQYASGTDEMDFWNVATSLIRPGNEERVVERVLASFSHGRTRDELEQLVKSFQRFLEGTTALVGQLLHETGYAEGTAMSPSMLRWMMHTAIWRKNTSGPEKLQEELFHKLLNYMRRYPRISTRFELPDGKGSMLPVILSPQSLKPSLPLLCRAFDVPLYDKPARHRSKGAAPGYERSHVKPFVEHGEGDTFLEPAPRNRSRRTNTESDPDDHSA
jgi:hypothetical protein